LAALRDKLKKLRNSNQRFPARQNLSHFSCWNTGGLQGLQHRRGIFSCDGEQQAAGSLRIEQNRFDLVWYARLIADHTFGELAICLESTRNIATSDAVQSSLEERNPSRINMNAGAASQRHFSCMTDQAKAGHVSRCMYTKLAAG